MGLGHSEDKEMPVFIWLTRNDDSTSQNPPSEGFRVSIVIVTWQKQGETFSANYAQYFQPIMPNEGTG